jgi:hypothetical protein
MSVAIPASYGAYKANVFIDDVILVVLNNNIGFFCGTVAALLAIHTICRPVSRCEPLPRNEHTANKKLLTKRLLREVKTTLGWLINI